MITLDRPWLEMDLGAPMQVLSWAVNRPGFATASRLLWREVRNRDLPPDLDIHDWVADQLGARGAEDAVLMITSRDITRYAHRRACIGAAEVDAVATVGLSNAERVGTRMNYGARDWGTINVGLRLHCGVTQAALVEALSIAAQARTAAVIDAAIDLPTGRATGTGTDCITVAAPTGETPYAGLHTDLGHAVGRAVYDAVQAGAATWKTDMEKARHART